MATPIQPGITDTTPQAPQTGPDAGNPSARTYTEADLAKARQQEKDKLYKEIEGLREQVTTLAPMSEQLTQLRAEQDQRLAAETEARQKAEDEARQKREAEMTAKELLEERQKSWEEKFAELQKERETERELLDKERQFAQLRDYTQGRIQQERENIAPELIDLVDGSTPEEVDASIERLKQKSAAIAEKVRGTQQQRAAQQQGVSPSGFSATGPLDMLPSTQQYSAEDIRAMSPREYAEKVRPHVLGGGDARNRGLFG